MAKAYNQYATFRYLIDAPIVCFSFLVATALSAPENTQGFGISTYVYSAVALIIWYLTSVFSKLYADRRSNKYSEEIIFIIYTLILYTIFLSSASFFLRHLFSVNGYFFLYFISLLFLLLTLTKYIIRKYLHAAIYQGKLFDNILLIGSTPAGLEFYETINKYYYYGYKCLGFLDDSNQKLNGCAYLGKLDQLNKILQTMRVDEVVIALANQEASLVNELVEQCEQHRTKTRILPHFHQYTSSTIQVNNIGLLPVMNIRDLPLDKWENRLLKRVFDILFSLSFFIFLGWWLLPLIAIVIRLHSKGPAFFLQERWGINNEKITCYKFRTMVVESTDTDEQGNYLQAYQEDPRVTGLGSFLRKTNLDELPQFWNVLMGNMSVVGPRPHPTPLNLVSMETVENYMMRHIVKPGITGWAQVNGARGATHVPGSMQQRVNFDLYYIHRWTFWLDGQIILQTIINIFRGDQNAY